MSMQNPSSHRHLSFSWHLRHALVLFLSLNDGKVQTKESVNDRPSRTRHFSCFSPPHDLHSRPYIWHPINIPMIKFECCNLQFWAKSNVWLANWSYISAVLQIPLSSSDSSSQSFLPSHTIFMSMQSPSVHLHFERLLFRLVSQSDEVADLFFPETLSFEQSFKTCFEFSKITQASMSAHLTYLSPCQLLHSVSKI